MLHIKEREIGGRSPESVRSLYPYLSMPTNVVLKARCMALNCGCKEVSTWIHAQSDCRAQILIGDDAHLRCRNGHDYHIKDWRMRCHLHADYREVDYMAFIEAVSSMGTSLRESGMGQVQAIEWMTRCLNSYNAAV